MPYAKYKTTILKWRENHKDAWNEYQSEYKKKNYALKGDKARACRMKSYYWSKECKRFRDILIDDI
jgi:hypothetical protein